MANVVGSNLIESLHKFMITIVVKIFFFCKNFQNLELMSLIKVTSQRISDSPNATRRWLDMIKYSNKIRQFSAYNFPKITKNSQNFINSPKSALLPKSQVPFYYNFPLLLNSPTIHLCQWNINNVRNTSHTSSHYVQKWV